MKKVVQSNVKYGALLESSLWEEHSQRFFADFLFIRSAASPSASHLLAFISCTILMTCLANMIGNEMAARIHGTVLSSLFALRRFISGLRGGKTVKGQAYRAISIAPADHGFLKRIDGLGAAGDPDCDVDGEFKGCRRLGESRGDEKERR